MQTEYISEFRITSATRTSTWCPVAHCLQSPDGRVIGLACLLANGLIWTVFATNPDVMASVIHRLSL